MELGESWNVIDHFITTTMETKRTDGLRRKD